jgi:hypothetical protein
MIKCTDHHITSNFADYQSFRTVPHAGTDYGHQGMTYFPFVAPDDGTILSTNGVDSFILDCPKVYEMEDGNKAHFQHQFVHINTPNLPKVGAFYKQGQVITKSGDSNGKAQPHLHWTCIVRWLRNGGGNNALCDGGRFVDTGEVWVSKNENGLQSWYQTSSWTGIPKGNPIALKLLFKSADKMIEELKKQLTAVQTELATLKGLYNEALKWKDIATQKDLEIANLTIKIDTTNAELIDFRTKSEANAKKLEADITQLTSDKTKAEGERDAFKSDNERIQKELLLCQSNNNNGKFFTWFIDVVNRFAEALRRLIEKKN